MSGLGALHPSDQVLVKNVLRRLVCPVLQGRAPQLTGPLDVSFVPDAPKTYAEFSALVSGRPAGDLPLIIARIRGANAAALAADNRRGLQVVLMDCRHHRQLHRLSIMFG
jgi:hypothetical protein